MEDVLSPMSTPSGTGTFAQFNTAGMITPGGSKCVPDWWADAVSLVTPKNNPGSEAGSPVAPIIAAPKNKPEAGSPVAPIIAAPKNKPVSEAVSPAAPSRLGPVRAASPSMRAALPFAASTPKSYREGSSPLKSAVYAPPARTYRASSPSMTLPISPRTSVSPTRRTLSSSGRTTPRLPYQMVNNTFRVASPAVRPMMTSTLPVSPRYKEKDPSGNAIDLITPAANFRKASKGTLEDKDVEEKDEHLIFNWLGWTPETSSICYQVLHKQFPGALPGEAVNNRIKGLLQTEAHGFTKANTLLGHSLCPDEINYEPLGLVDLMKQEWGHMFPLGGISGAPFVGVTGFKAFSHHVPDDGNIIIIFGPHVALSREGIIGKVRREGQNHLSTACGAVIGAYNACCASNIDEEDFNPADMQMGWIKSQLQAHIDLIQAQPNPMAALAYQAYEMVKAKLEHIVNLDFGSGKLVLIGGIQINMPEPFQEHFVPLSFDVRQKGKVWQNLLPDFSDFNQEEIDITRTSTKSDSSVFKDFRNVFSPNAFSPNASSPKAFSPKADLDVKAGKQHALFSWLAWSPEPGTPCFQTLRREFPGALPGAGVHGRLKKILTEEHGFTQDNTLFGTSICPDEINNSANGVANLMSRYWGSVFPLGGLAGVPFAGITGFKAFSHHVPVNGDIIVLYGPHVGISASGEVGKHLRKGQADSSTACGACIGAYNACCARDGGDFEFDETDLQMGWIKTQIAPHANRIRRQQCPMAALAYQAFEAVNSQVSKVVNTEFGSGRLVLIGGIQLNMPEPLGDHFLPLSCEVQQAGKPSFDIRDVFSIPEPEEDGFFAGDMMGA